MIPKFTLVCLVVVCSMGGSLGSSPMKESWYQNGTFYYINLPYFKDSSSDCKGDIQGVIDKMEYLKELKVTGVVLSHIYSDADFKQIRTEYGKMEDFDNLAKKLNDSGIGLILEIDLFSTFKNNSWFNSKNHYYINQASPPNWVDINGDSAWKKDNKTYYLSIFGDEKVHLDLTNEELNGEINDIFSFWLGKGVNGFRINRASYLIPNTSIDETQIKDCSKKKYKCYLHDGVTTNTKNTFEKIYSWFKVLNETSNWGPRILILDPYLRESAREVVEGFVKNGAHLVLSTVVDDSTIQESYERFTSITDSPLVKNLAWKTWDMRPAFSDGLMLDNVNIETSLLPGAYLLLAGDEIAMKRLDRGFQWDSSPYSGFSNCSERIPDLVNFDYITLNLKLEEQSETSHLNLVKRMKRLRQNLVKATNLTFHYINEAVYLYSRQLGNDIYIVLLHQDEFVNSFDLSNISTSKQLHVHTSSLMSTYKIGETVNTNEVRMNPFSAVVLTNASVSSGSIVKLSLTLLLVCFTWLHL